MNSSSHTARPSIVVIGIGNEFRGDDASGIIASRALRGSGEGLVNILEHHREGTTLMDLWEGADIVLLIDAVSSGAPPGTIFRRDVTATSIPEIPFRQSTHSISIADGIEFARLANKLPPKIIFYGIEGKNFTAGTSLSPEVESSIPRFLRKIRLELSEIAHSRPKEDQHA